MQNNLYHLFITNSSVQDSERPLSDRASHNDYTTPTILTKQQLKAEAKPRDKSRRSSTDDETPVGVQMPEDTGAESESPYSLPQKANTKKYNKTAED